MVRLNSFYFSSEYWPSLVGDTALLKGEEARHMLTVLRTQSEQIVRLFDGNGRDGLFHVKEAGKKRALLEAIQLNDNPRTESGVTLAIGWGKSKRRNYLFEKAVEFNGQGVVFWSAARSQGKMPWAAKETWREKCIQAAKQCGNPYLPELGIVSDGISGLIEFAEDFDHCYLAWESDDAIRSLTPSDLRDGRNLLIIGPEGGLENNEANQLQEGGVIPVTLGPSILRWETAATYCLSLAFFAGQE